MTTLATPRTLIPVTVILAGHSYPLIGRQITPHLAVTPGVDYERGGPVTADTPLVFTGGWVVTHLPTGLRIPGGGSYTTTACLHHAILFAEHLADTDIDWSAPREVLAADRDIRETCRKLGADFAACNHPTDCMDLPDEYPTTGD